MSKVNMTQRVTLTLSKDMDVALRESAWKSRQNVSEWLRGAIENKLNAEGNGVEDGCQ